MVFLVYLPNFYHKFFDKSDYPVIFYFNQTILLISGFLHLAVSLKIHEKLKIPPYILYCLVGTVMESAEKKLTEIPVYTIISLITPNGIESSIISFTSTLISLNIYTIKALSGVYVN